MAISDYDPDVRLRQHMEGLIDRRCSPSDILDVMRLCRLVMEKSNSRATHRHLSLYCDWLMHVTIDRNRLAIKMLERVNNGIVAHLAGAAGDMVAAINHSISLAELRREMVELFTEHSVNTAITESLTNWRMFTGVLLRDLSHRPITLPSDSNEADRATARMLASWAGQQHPMWPKAFYFLAEPDDSGQIQFFWEAEMGSTEPGRFLRFKGWVQITETEADFVRA